MLNGFSRYADLGKLLLRIVIAAIFLYHGSQKWGFWSAAPDGMPSGMVTLFQVLSIVEPLAGLTLLLGLMTRLSALVLGIVMIGAIYMKAAVMGLGFAEAQGTGWEFDLMILAGCFMLLCEGGGKYAMGRK